MKNKKKRTCWGLLCFLLCCGRKEDRGEAKEPRKKNGRKKRVAQTVDKTETSAGRNEKSKDKMEDIYKSSSENGNEKLEEKMEDWKEPGSEKPENKEEKMRESEPSSPQTPRPSWFSGVSTAWEQPSYCSGNFQPYWPTEQATGIGMWGNPETYPSENQWPYFPWQIQPSTPLEMRPTTGMWHPREPEPSGPLMTKEEFWEEWNGRFNEPGGSGDQFVMDVPWNVHPYGHPLQTEEACAFAAQPGAALNSEGYFISAERHEELLLYEPDEQLYVELWEFGEGQGDQRFEAKWEMTENGEVVAEGTWHSSSCSC
ncbi:uncharacterized protein [Lepisosteus oculatus]|uniref:uncharacterized protein n=1 Tax=Lepisosteus oculatus TaxID=7918 RepID=UPI0035F50242